MTSKSQPVRPEISLDHPVSAQEIAKCGENNGIIVIGGTRHDARDLLAKSPQLTLDISDGRELTIRELGELANAEGIILFNDTSCQATELLEQVAAYGDAFRKNGHQPVPEQLAKLPGFLRQVAEEDALTTVVPSPATE